MLIHVLSRESITMSLKERVAYRRQFKNPLRSDKTKINLFGLSGRQDLRRIDVQDFI
jgi:hypothetical protein